MKLIALNTWGGRIKDPFIKFVEDNKDVDVFCFQEVYKNAEKMMGEEYPDDMHNSFIVLQTLLPDHQGFFRPALLGVYGLAIFIKNSIALIGEGEILIHPSQSELVSDGHHARNMQWVKFTYDGKDFTVMNVHGLWNGAGKNDSPQRILQSNVIREFMDKIETSKILCGDFNLNPDTESVKILEKSMRNLVKDYSVISTRTSLYTKPGKFADYIFTSPDINIKEFKVLPEEVSDHAALFLEI